MKRKTAKRIIIGSLVCAAAAAYLILQWTAAPSTERTAAVTAQDGEAPESESGGAIAFAQTAGLQQVYENESLALLLDPATTEIAVKDKRSGMLWYSNPQDRDQDKKAEGPNRDNLSAQFSIAYNNDKGQSFAANNYAESVKRKQFGIARTAKGVKITYRLGNFQQGLEAIPTLISKARMDEKILGKLADEKQRFEIEKRFFLDEETQIYKRKEIPDYVVADIVAILEQAGYAAEDAKADNAANNAGGEQAAATARFTVPIEYELDGAELRVRIAASEVTDTPAFPIQSIKLLEMFGAAGAAEQGYMFIPDGSGALIYLNNGKTSALPYDMPVYGNDRTLLAKENEGAQPPEPATPRFPVYGMKKGDHAFLAMIEEGDAIASVHADISGRVNVYNRAYAEFLIKPMEMFTYRVGAVAKNSPLFPEMFGGEIEIRYAFLSGADSDYSGMANYYRGALVRQGKLKPMQGELTSPFILELAGAIDVRKTILGVPYSSSEALTTFKQARSLLERLKAKRVDHIKLRYSGWFNGGIDHDYPDDVEIERALGGAKGFGQLNAYAGENGIKLYPDVALQRVSRGGEGFKPSRDGAAFLFREGIRQMRRDPVTTNKDGTDYYVLSPKKLTGLVDDFLKDFRQLGTGGLSLRDLGEDVNSTVSSRATLDRQASASLVAQSAAELAEEAGKLMVSGGNGIVLPYADTVVHAPLAGSRLYLADEDVPFYEMVVHGFVDYAGAPVNLSRDQDYASNLLKSLETGASLYVLWFYGDPAAVRGTDFNDLYAAHYSNWFEEAIRAYHELNEAVGDVRLQPIVKHEKLADNVYRTTYERGKRVTVNYNAQAVTIDGTRIEGRGYRIEGGRT
ncbi:DUF5696 domain-containing protein [Paenibacillus methanolicus]|uniref:Uncharacterized protein n=1 Tax=Paenibacillus methanolicus TaxID=582686 RepID=A0A5S5CJF6_9BACL|nr:DUF5696 domain-containing protein [Paenibacillus methanolicus]TYP79822.1 hypothetical protein BCM02_101943 [Paenibacillus methanolicus]